jgi:hypothetical protein
MVGYFRAVPLEAALITRPWLDSTMLSEIERLLLVSGHVRSSLFSLDAADSST